MGTPRIPIKIHPFFWVFAFIIGWLNSSDVALSLIWVLIIVVSVLVHECGHAVSAIIFGQRVRIELVAFGGLTYREGAKLRPWQDFIVVLCGPLAGFLLYLVAYVILSHTKIQSQGWLYALQVTATVNLIWTLLNLLPVIPLDGGRLFSIILEAIFGFNGFKAALIISVVLGFALSLISFVFGQLFLGILFFLLGYESLRSSRYINVMSVQDRDESLQSFLKKGQAKRDSGNQEDALAIFQEVRDSTKKGIIYSSATESMAHILAEKGKGDEKAMREAYDLLLSLPSKTVESTSLLHRIAFQLKDYEMVVKTGTEVYQLVPNYETALLNAVANAALNKAEAAVGWLGCAIRENAPNLELLLKKHEFDQIRNNPLFEKFLRNNFPTN